MKNNRKKEKNFNIDSFVVKKSSQYQSSMANTVGQDSL